jgi:hypothetical protein
MAQARWERCIYQRGSEVERFIKEFLADTHRRILLLAGAGFDPRSTVICRSLAAHVASNVSAIFLREDRPNPSEVLVHRAEENVERLRGLLQHVTFETIQVFAEDGAVVGGRRVAATIEKIDLQDYTDIIVDFSSLSKGITFPSVRHILDRCMKHAPAVNVHLMVTDEVSTDMQIKEVGADRAALIAGFEGGWWLSDRQDRAKLWLPQLIGDRHLLLDRIFRFVNPDDVCPILPFPAKHPRRPDELIEEYADEFQSVWEVDPRDLVYADEKNPLDLYRTILRLDDARTRVFDETGGSTIVLSPLGSKVLAIGSLMAAIERDFPVVHVEAIEYRVDFDKIEEARTEPGEVVHVWLQGEAYAN